MTLPTYATSQLRVAGKIRWLLATWLADYVEAVRTQADAILPDVAAVYVGSDAGALPQTVDTVPAIVCVPVSSTVTEAVTGDAPGGVVTSVAVWAVRAVADADEHGPDGAAYQAQALALAAAQLLCERMREPDTGDDSGTWVYLCALVQDGALPQYAGDSQHRIVHEAQVEIHTRSADAVIATRYPSGIGVVPCLPTQQCPATLPPLELTGDVVATVPPGGEGLVVAWSYTTGLALSTGTGAALTLVAQRAGYPVHTVADGGTVTPGDLSAMAGDVWTASGVHPVTGAILPYRIRFT